MQRIYEVADLPQDSLEAGRVFSAQHLARARALLGDDEVSALVIALPPAGRDHDDWRTALARDLARAHTPSRVNIISGPQGANRTATLAYLANAPGVTGQYLCVHA